MEQARYGVDQVSDDMRDAVMQSCRDITAWARDNPSDIHGIVRRLRDGDRMRLYVARMRLGKGTELIVNTMLRRLERAFGVAIRKAQADGLVVKSVGGGRTDPNMLTVEKASDGLAHQVRTRGYTLADKVNDELFEVVLARAASQGDVGWNNVARNLRGQVKEDRWKDLRRMAAEGHTSTQISKKLGYTAETVREKARREGIEIPADVVTNGVRHIDSNRVLLKFVETLESLVPSCDLIVFSNLKPEVLEECGEVLSESMKELRKLERRLKEGMG